MNAQELKAIDSWFDAVQKSQPENSLAMLLYVRDGRVILGRKGSDVEMREFDLHNLPQVMELVNEAIGTLYDKGVPDAVDE